MRTRSVALAITLLSAVAHAEPTAVCLSANEKAQQLRSEKHFREAAEQLRVCSQSSCPSAVQRDCAQWLREVEASLPTITFAAKDAKGRDLFDVTVDVDGKNVLKSLDGSAIPIDPGRHSVTFRHDGEITQEVLITEGEKARRIEVRFGGSDSGEEPQRATSHSRFSPWPFVLGGLGVAAIGGGIAMHVAGASMFPAECNAENKKCDLDKNPTSAADAQTSKNLERAGIGVAIGGGVLLAGGISWFIFEAVQSKPEARAHRTPRLIPQLGLGYAGLAGTF